MPFVEVFTREKLSDEVRTKLAEELSNTVMTVEVGGPTESAKLIDWMWFHTMPAAMGGRPVAFPTQRPACGRPRPLELKARRGLPFENSATPAGNRAGTH
jgi:hypothetical protein